MAPPRARELVARLNGVPHVRNIQAQADARFVLFTVREEPGNFPHFAEDLDEQATLAGYSYLAAGCALAENGLRSEAADALVRGAVLLEQVHAPIENRTPSSSFHHLVSAMAFYAAGQYSRAFVAIRSLEWNMIVARLVAAFLRRRYQELLSEINEVLLGEAYGDPSVSSAPEAAEEDPLGLGADGRVMAVLVARALSLALEFVYSGDRLWVLRADEVLQDAMELALLLLSPLWWWIARLLRLMLSDLHRASPWIVLPPYFPDNGSTQLGRYIQILAHQTTPVTELWTSQRDVLPQVLNPARRGVVVSLPTGAGKTRVAETAILHSLLRDSDGKTLYIAPFRSLAIEVERSLAATLGELGYRVSHLYGGGRASSVDRVLADEAHILVATPEKAKAILRAMPDLCKSIRLVVVDEGHLFGLDRRLIRNEMFLEHVRTMCKKTEARMVLLSAVLPNLEEVAIWVAGEGTAVAKSSWRPSDQRLGYLEWTGQHVRLEWLGQIRSFNPRFVVRRRVTRAGRRRDFPGNKIEAVAAAAIRLSQAGPVLIFIGNATSMRNYARALVLALGDSPSEHEWPAREWEVFVASCRECYAEEPPELNAARYGILCHSAKLPDEVRLAMEQLMRAGSPRVIVATTTLAQGVNIGVSTVIIANPWIEDKRLSVRDFWNIAGRAGRAFVDGEGRILFTIDLTREQWQIRRDRKMAQEYFAKGNLEPVTSGILEMLRELHKIAARANIRFELLLEMIAENDFTLLAQEDALRVSYYWDLVDDVILALHSELEGPEGSDPVSWIDDVFRGSLAAICAGRRDSPFGPDEVLSLLRHRARGVVKLARARAGWPSLVASGLPLSAALRLDQLMPSLKQAVAEFSATDGQVEDLNRFVCVIDNTIRSLPGRDFRETPDEGILGIIRPLWLSGRPLREILLLDSRALEVCREHYGYRVPWVINAVARYLATEAGTEAAEVCDRIALLVEIGVPTEAAAKLFLCGIRSRAAAVELAGHIPPKVAKLSLSEVAEYITSHHFVDLLRGRLSEDTMIWVQNLAASRRGQPTLPNIPEFRIRNDPFTCLTVQPRERPGGVFLCSPDYREKLEVKSTSDFPWHLVANDLRVAFRKTDSGTWRMEIRDPRVRADS